MSHTPTAPAPQGNAAVPKPTLAGVRVRQRKGAAKATAKLDPEGFRDSLLLHLALVPSPPTVPALVDKLLQAGSTLELLKYYEQLFEILFIGGLLQPGGSYLDDKRSPVYVLQPASETASENADESFNPVTGMVETLKRVMQRYKYLQKPLEENFLPDILGYLPKWTPEQRAKFAEAVALLVLEVNISPKCLFSLTKEHVVKDNVSLSFLTAFAKTYLSKQNMDHLGLTFRRSGLKDIALVIPHQTRTRKQVEDHFKAEGLPMVSEWYTKMAMNESKEDLVQNIVRMLNEEEPIEQVSLEPGLADQILEQLKSGQAEKPVADADMVDWVWQALMKSFDWTARPDQIDAAMVAHITANAPLLEAFAQGAKAEVSLINAVQVYCYADTRLLKTFPHILKVLYNKDCVSDQAIIYWHQKGAKPNGKQHFLKMTEAMVKFLEEQDSDEE